MPSSAACISFPTIRRTRSRARRCGSICPISPPRARSRGLPAVARAAEGPSATTGSRPSRAGSARTPGRYGCPLLGGDTVRTPGPVTISITAFGTVPKGTMVRRAGARPGDRVVVTGTIGDAALGLKLRKERGAAKRWKLDAAMQRHLLARYLVPRAAQRAGRGAAPLRLGRDGCVRRPRRRSRQALPRLRRRRRDRGRARAAVRGGAGGAGGRSAADRDHPHRRRRLRGGRDRSAAQARRRFAAAARRAGVPVTEIGRVTAGQGARFLDADGRPLRFARTSFSHF